MVPLLSAEGPFGVLWDFRGLCPTRQGLLPPPTGGGGGARALPVRVGRPQSPPSRHAESWGGGSRGGNPGTSGPIRADGVGGPLNTVFDASVSPPVTGPPAPPPGVVPGRPTDLRRGPPSASPACPSSADTTTVARDGRLGPVVAVDDGDSDGAGGPSTRGDGVRALRATGVRSAPGPAPRPAVSVPDIGPAGSTTSTVARRGTPRAPGHRRGLRRRGPTPGRRPTVRRASPPSSSSTLRRPPSHPQSCPGGDGVGRRRGSPVGWALVGAMETGEPGWGVP